MLCPPNQPGNPIISTSLRQVPTIYLAVEHVLQSTTHLHGLPKKFWNLAFDSGSLVTYVRYSILLVWVRRLRGLPLSTTWAPVACRHTLGFLHFLHPRCHQRCGCCLWMWTWSSLPTLSTVVSFSIHAKHVPPLTRLGYTVDIETSVVMTTATTTA